MADSPALSARLIRLAVPVAIGRLGIVGMGVVDAMVVGQLAPRELAHQGLAWTVTGPAVHGGIGLLLGVQVLAARALGADQRQEAGGIWRRGLVISAASGLLVCALVTTAGSPLFIVFGIAPPLAERAAAVAAVLSISVPLHLMFIASTNFLEAQRLPVPGAMAMWAANGVNLVLNLALVPNWGAIGSAWATVLSRLFLAASMAGYILLIPSQRPLLARTAAPVRYGYLALLAVGGAAALSAMVESGAFAAMSVICGRIGNTAVATFVIATGSIVTLVYLLAQGFATAGAVLVSEAIGRGSDTEARRIGWTAIGLTALAMAICGVGCVAFAAAVARAFTSDAAIMASLTSVMVLVALLMTPDGGQGVADSLLRARGDNWFPTVVRLSAFVLVAPPLALWLAEGRAWGVAGVLEALLAASLLAYVTLLARLALKRSTVAAGELARRNRGHDEVRNRTGES